MPIERLLARLAEKHLEANTLSFLPNSTSVEKSSASSTKQKHLDSDKEMVV